MVDDPDKLITLSLLDDPVPALQKAQARAREQVYAGRFLRLISGVGLVVVIALLYVAYNDYLAHKQELPGLIARGRRIAGQLSSEPTSASGRFNYVGARWRVEYSYTVDGRAHAGSAHMRTGDRPASIAVVFDPQNPAAHRVVGSLEPSNLDGQRLLMLGAMALVLGFIFLVTGLLPWLDRLRE